MSIEKICGEVIDEWNKLNPRFIEPSLKNAFVSVIKYLNQFPENLSVRSKKNPPDTKTKDGIMQLAVLYFNGFYSPTVPKLPQTVPDEMVSFIMEIVFNHSKSEMERIKTEHLESMAAENAVGALLERYLDSVLRTSGWAWCCGNFVRAIDFIKFENGVWYELQVKNRSNTENSSSSKIREGTSIHKWYRTKAATGETMWNHLPPIMQGFGLCENGFRDFVKNYLKSRI